MKFTTKTHLSILIAALALSQACANVTEQECEDNTRRCNDNIIETCVNGYWNFTTACNADTCTIDAQGNPFCKPADPTNTCLSKCTDGILFLCQDDGSTSTENCLNKNMICGILDDGTPACVDKAQTCQSICKDGFLSICHDDGSVSTQNCANQNMICGILNDGTLTCVDKTQTCQTTCKNNILSHCHEDGSITTENCKLSDKICGFDASGTPTCITNTQSKQCDLNGTAMQIGQQLCDADGNIATCLDDGSIQSTPCERGICVQNECAARACDDIEDGQNICKDNKLMVCDDGSLKEAAHGCAQNTTCRDGQNQCSPYNKCGSIAHNATGCLNGNVVTCNDGTTSLLTNCVSKDQFCAPNPEIENGFYCKSPDPTDCEWNGELVEKDKTICDGNLLRTCSALINTEFDEGTDCIELDPNKPICDTNLCREEKYCGNNLDITPGSIVCNQDKTNKAECIDGTLVDLTDDDACSARENAHSICIFTTEAICSDACNAGFTDVNGTCETIKTCDAVKEKYNETTNTCVCNDEAHYIGDVGNCQCETGYFERKNQCKAGCLYDDIEYQYGDSACNSEGKLMTCQTDGTMLDATCEIGVCIDGECVTRSCGDLKNGEYQCQSGSLMLCNDGTLAAAPTPCTANQLCLDGQNACVEKTVCTATGTMLNNKTNTCVCNSSKGWTGDGTDCHCKDGDVPINNECVAKAICDENKEIYNNSSNTCSCDSDKHWTGSVGSCTCENGYVQIGNACELKKTCDATKETYDSSTNTCLCNTANHWTGIAGSCTCATNYVLIGNTCELKKTCDATKETYDSSTNTCLCNTTNHWTGTAGSCTCATNYVQLGNTCELKKTCDATKETYDSSTNTCACNTANHWTGIAGSCTCATNYVQLGNTCELKKTCDATKETYNSSTNTCACNTANHWTGTAGSCTCANDYVLLWGTCELKKSCDSVKETYQAATNTCACNYDKHFVGEPNACQCENGYVQLGNTCELKKTCDSVKETYNTTTNSCSCNTANHWTGTAGSCTCATNYVLIDNTCELKKTCDTTKETYVSATNTCACNTANHWAGTAGSCTCATNYVQLGNTCELKKTCDSVKEIYQSATNSCSCNYAKHFVGAPNNCQCENGYVLIGNACELKKTCDAVKETYNSSTNTCTCNTANHWTGTAGSCTCETGYYLDGNTCKPDDAQHCRGIDCTAVSYWADGICTSSGQCQVTECNGDTHLYINGSVNTCENNSPEHCGVHGNACEDGYPCVNGECLGNTNCGGETHNTATDLDHCGACNHRCNDGTTCIVGECVAGNGPAYCGDSTVQLNTPEHCESCAPCADGLICQNNQCVSGQGEMICNHIVVNSKSDSANCGSCGHVCQAGFKCVNSTCERIADLSTATITCNAQTVKPYTDRNNCGGCGIACSSTTACHNGVCTTPQVGDIITFGHYEQDNDTTNGKEPISWRILDVKDGKHLIISEKALDEKPYNTTQISITWAKSTIRSWLNGYDASYNTVGTSYTSDNFINTAFTNEEKAKIVTSNVPAHANPDYSTVSPGNATTDKIFLLSITEAQQYFTSNADRQADATRYAVKKGVFVQGSVSGKTSYDGSCTDVHCYSSWWLRSPGYYSSYAAFVRNVGSFQDSGVFVDCPSYAVRPALWVELE